MPNRAQGNLIQLINQYLEWNNLPLRWDEGGVCNGLSHVYAKYVLAGKEERFFNTIDKILELYNRGFDVSDALIPDEDIDHFICQVILAHSPDLFDKQYNQTNSVDFINTNTNTRPMSVDLIASMATTKENWIKIFKDELKMQEGEVFIIRSAKHTVTLKRTNNQYELYDPNYHQGKKIFANESELIEELDTNVFWFNSDLNGQQRLKNNNFMGLAVHKITSGEENQNISRKSAVDLYEQYTDPIDVSQSHEISGEPIPNSVLLTEIHDDEFHSKIFENFNDSVDFRRLPVDVISANNYGMLTAVINRMCDFHPDKTEQIEKEIVDLLARKGKLALFQQLTQTDMHETYMKTIRDPGQAHNLLCYAAEGGQAELIKKVLTDINNIHQRSLNCNERDSLSPMPTNTRVSAENRRSDFVEENHFVDPRDAAQLVCTKNFETGKDIIEAAIKSGSHEAVSVLLKELHNNIVLSPRKVANYLEQAIEKNNYHMVKSLLKCCDDATSTQLMQNLNIRITLAEKTQHAILRLLKEKGAQFSGSVDKIYQSKMNHSMSFWDNIGISLASFVEFIKNQKLVEIKLKPTTATQTPDIKDRANAKRNFRQYKSRVQTLSKSPFESDENIGDHAVNILLR